MWIVVTRHSGRGPQYDKDPDYFTNISFWATEIEALRQANGHGGKAYPIPPEGGDLLDLL